jgi:TonB-linked SusC/RagA family outer membrane protein
MLAQVRTVSGTVTSSEDASPLPGVNVVVSGTTNGTVTDASGHYSLSVPQEGGMLIFSFIGFQSQEVEIGTRSTVDVQMTQDVTQLSEIVVTALGIEKEERSLGYAVTSVNNEELIKTQSPSALNALQGKVAGVNITSASGAPGASSRIILRGFSSLGGANQPLFVVDGVPINNGVVNSDDLNGGLDFGNRINDLNPEDIESVSILKGASGTTLYGSRAASGVIVITTKKGKAGVKRGTQITVNSSLTLDTPLKLPTFQNRYGQGFFNERDLLENTSWGPKFDGKDRLWGHVVNNSQQLKPYVAQPDNAKDFWDVGKTYNNTVAISNGDDKSNYYLSYGNVNADGIMPTDADSYNRNTISMRGSTSLSNKITASASLNYVAKNNKFVPTGQDQSVYDNVMQTPRDISIVDHKDYKSLFNNLDNYFSGYTLNPYYVLNEHGATAGENRFFGNVALSYPITDYLKITDRFGGDVSSTHMKSWRAITQVSRNDYNDDPGRVIVQDFFNRELNNDVMLNFNKTFGELNVGALIGHNFNQREYRSSSAAVTGLDLPFFYDLSNSSATPVIDEYFEKRRIIGAYGSVDLSYRNFLFLTLNARNDWSSTLPKENRSFFYPGVNGAVDLAGLIPSLENIFTMAKIRAGWTKVGKDASPYLIRSVFVKADQFDGYRSLKYPLAGNINAFEVSNRIGNPGLTPEFTTEFEIGGDLRFFDGRVRLDGAYYERTITDLIWNADLSYATGYSSQTLNLGEITNTGVELLLSASPVMTGNFSWDISVNYTRNRNRLVELTEGLDQIDLGGTGSLAFVARPGQPLGLFLGPVPLLDPQGRIIVNSQGLPTADPENQIYGNSQYDFMAGLTNELKYKGISLGFTLDLRQGGLMYSRTAEMMYFTGTAPNTIYNDRQPFIIPNSVIETAPGEYVENTTPLDAGSIYSYWGQSYGGGEFNKRFLVSKSFLKLRELRIGYSLPASLLSHTPFGSIDVSLIGRNLLVWTPSDNHFIDPESTTFGNDLEADYGEFSATPTVRSMGVNVRLTF